MPYTSFDKDTATPNEKGSLMFTDPIFGLWRGTCQSGSHQHYNIRCNFVFHIYCDISHCCQPLWYNH